jgi:hypothetical protein
VLYNSSIDKQEVTLMICGLQYLQDTRCAGVEGVILDPSAEMAGTSAEGERLDEAACMSRRCFMERLMGRGRAWFEGRSQRETSEA